ncbi:MAG: pyridoxal phosphate-dependent aminotransferase family protein [Sediminibacterium sp. Gen4]|jgi:glycine C-acetyltransferase|uniref:aminotransferase class I/II-fold pyridoxal phosphate-dependent enzyme n=1 Tax=unclassified Sediminibacterium TaxID=2635961 RepID=UPI0015BCAB33|nr:MULTISPECIES: pyridoxal phosphate-dependent aminotransferase family protein [unclassified Sediminibacterium]MBW0160290.1 pyridoxal phosphate-dependent aminotransferase family protein [Sediminibacterium sp.]MBW0163506.1 pyridoxal phosphate-dependent aminotransferase family protein [Sediminibacterium sp.]NWK65768.1 pyridoxal phosphate-dependent aminotransferase family protein [Sediminibacterium sp. Gen4]
MADIFEKLVKNYGPIGQHRERAHGYFAFPKLEGEIGSRMIFRGKEMIVWSLNNYLGLANHPEIRKTDAEASQQYGLALPMGARMMSGNSNFHEQLERELAAFESKEDAILMNFGYQGIMSAIDAICGRHDVIVYDAESHACIIDGLRLHPGHRYVFKHNDLEDFEKQLQRATALIEKQKTGGILVITEGVFGMAGDQGKLKEIAALKKKYDFRLLVDDAHGFGTLGKTGAGAGEEQGCQDDIDLYFSTFAKSMASIGAFMAGPKIIIDFIRYNIRSQIFAKSLPMPIVIGNLKRLEMLRNMPELKEKLWSNAMKLQNGLKERGFDIGKTDTPVTPVYMKGGVEEATAMVMDLRENYHIFCSIVVYPVIPKGHIIYRLIPTAAHTDQDIEETLKAFSETKAKLDAGAYKAEAIPDMAETKA